MSSLLKRGKMTKLPMYDNITKDMETAACVQMCDFLPAVLNEAAMGQG